MGHIKMCGTVQPFLSGAISKTVNLPNSATVEEIKDAYIQGWKHGMKSVSIYRDGCKLVSRCRQGQWPPGPRGSAPEHAQGSPGATA